MISFRDSILDELAERGIWGKKAAQEYLYNSHFEAGNLNVELSGFFDKVEMREKDGDIK